MFKSQFDHNAKKKVSNQKFLIEMIILTHLQGSIFFHRHKEQTFGRIEPKRGISTFSTKHPIIARRRCVNGEVAIDRQTEKERERIRKRESAK